MLFITSIDLLTFPTKHYNSIKLQYVPTQECDVMICSYSVSEATTPYLVGRTSCFNNKKG